MRDLIIWGATGHARVLDEFAGSLGFRTVVTIDRREVPPPIDNVPVLVGLEGLKSWLGARKSGLPLFGVVAIGGAHGPDRREVAAQMRDLGIEIVTMVHPSANIAQTAKIGDASQILIGATVAANVQVGASVIINSSASVDHDCVIGDGTHIGPGSTLAGEIIVEADVFVGTGATVLPRLTIGKGATVGAGAVVTRSVGAGMTVVGIPARPV